MKDWVNAIVIIPAKTDSTRLKKKNLQQIAGKTLVEHALEYSKRSTYVRETWVNTESNEIREIAKRYGVNTLERSPELMGDAEVADVYVDSMKQILGMTKVDPITHVIALQPDHPDRTRNLDELIDYFIDNKYDDLVTVDKHGVRNGSIRITKSEYVISGQMSRRVGTQMDDCTNVHGQEDLENAEKNILEGRAYL